MQRAREEAKVKVGQIFLGTLPVKLPWSPSDRAFETKIWMTWMNKDYFLKFLVTGWHTWSCILR